MIVVDPKIVELDESWPQPLQALWWLKKGDLKVGSDWQRAHDICQQKEGDGLHDWVHALVHWIEDDSWNAGHWYKSAAREGLAGSIEAEWEAISRKMSTDLGL